LKRRRGGEVIIGVSSFSDKTKKRKYEKNYSVNIRLTDEPGETGVLIKKPLIS